MSTLNSQTEKLALLRHSVSHVMAQAVTKLFPGTRVAIGPSIENGFYYDFQFPPSGDGQAPLTEGDLPAVEAEMKRIIDSKVDFVRIELGREAALRRFAEEPFKTELIRELPADTAISVYENRDSQGNVLWADLCRGPHVANTREINSAA
ncbi:MAG: threonine--tRNA ligase, partial [Treponema sp.]|nr:threonine--tRNA ligase [Treponema sp.]